MPLTDRKRTTSKHADSIQVHLFSTKQPSGGPAVHTKRCISVYLRVIIVYDKSVVLFVPTPYIFEPQRTCSLCLTPTQIVSVFRHGTGNPFKQFLDVSVDFTVMKRRKNNFWEALICERRRKSLNSSRLMTLTRSKGALTVPVVLSYY